MSLAKTYIATRKGSKNLQLIMRLKTSAKSLKGQSRLIRLDDDVTVNLTFADKIVISLQTKNEDVAKRRELAARRQLESIFAAASSPPAKITYRQMVMYSGIVYHASVELHKHNPGKPYLWRATKALHRAVVEGRIIQAPKFGIDTIPDETDLATDLFGPDLTRGVNALPVTDSTAALEQRFGALADFVLDQHMIRLDHDDRVIFLQEVAWAAIDAGRELAKNANRDFSPDPVALRFPPLENAPREAVSVTKLLNSWWDEAKAGGRKPATFKAYAGVVRAFERFLKHDDATKVTQDDVIRFKDHRRESGLSLKSIRDVDLVALKTIFGWGLSNRKVASNPAHDVKVAKIGRKQRIRDPGFSDAEALAILRAAFNHQPPKREQPKMTAAIRWIPWLQAYSGARVGEVAQIRAEDIVSESGIKCIRLTPEAGTLKAGDFRLVPLHPHLIELGFDKWAKGRKGRLFAKSAPNRVAAFARAIVPDPGVDSTHGWRHRLKKQARDLGLSERVVDEIQGHVPTTEGGKYGGDTSVKAKARLIQKLPRYRPDKPKARKPRKARSSTQPGTASRNSLQTPHA